MSRFTRIGAMGAAMPVLRAHNHLTKRYLIAAVAVSVTVGAGIGLANHELPSQQWRTPTTTTVWTGTP